VFKEEEVAGGGVINDERVEFSEVRWLIVQVVASGGLGCERNCTSKHAPRPTKLPQKSSWGQCSKLSIVMRLSGRSVEELAEATEQLRRLFRVQILKYSLSKLLLSMMMSKRVSSVKE
jgi:hypothetical protein